MVQRGDPCEIMKMRNFMVQRLPRIIWFSDFTWLNYENGPFEGLLMVQKPILIVQPLLRRLKYMMHRRYLLRY
jgi:hypothetical protein